jgi:hypothetical protein
VTRTQTVRAARERVRAATSPNVIDLKIIGIGLTITGIDLKIIGVEADL